MDLLRALNIFMLLSRIRDPAVPETQVGAKPPLG
jgi:hypothetical protein